MIKLLKFIAHNMTYALFITHKIDINITTNTILT
ncbi:hypothetical protein VA7868_03347 [Vibrio aerogenes CECT 7868]|uniref:Uncharacterized protein n=1 Tax=Vibrio aerogenes CECT 7868 TaxID=1216006 RepID=A0A1M5ZWD4_9VIBR|nr:hypothetical protein VA7868_03347 [Vibrio aerogenes CECT 7868]